MPTRSPNYLALKITALLDGRQFYDHWHEKFRNAQLYGSSAKSLCPFHLGESFRTFLLDLQKKTFRCTITQCRGAGGGTFADLHALLIDEPLLEALLDLCSTFKPVLPDDVRLLFGATLAERARELMSEGKLEAAESVAVQAFKKDAANASLQMLLAEICETRGRPADASPYYHSVLQEAIAEKNWMLAATVLGRLRSLEPDQNAYAEQAAAIAEAQGDRAHAIACYLDLASRSAVAPAQQREWLERARSLDPAHPEILERLGALAEQRGETDQAAAIWKSLTEVYRQTDRPEQALEVFNRMARLQPDLQDLDEQRADLLFAAHRNDEARQVLRGLAERAIKQGTAERVEGYLRRICDAFPNDIEAHWLLLRLLEQTDREDNAALIADRLLALGDAETMGERYVEVLKRLKQWRPNNILYRERLATYYANQDDVEAALAEMRELVERSFQRGAQTDALRRIERMHAVAANHPRRRLEIAQLLVAHDCRNEAAGEYESIARQSAADDPPLAEEACAQGLLADDSRPGLHEILLQISLPHQPDRALEHCRRLVDFHRARSDAAKAIALLEWLRPRLPQAIEPRLWLAELLIESDQPDPATKVLGEIAALELSPDQITKATELASGLISRRGPSVELLHLQASLCRRGADRDLLVETLLQLAAAQEGAGALAEAEAAYAEALTVRPDDPRAVQGQTELARRRQGLAAPLEAGDGAMAERPSEQTPEMPLTDLERRQRHVRLLYDQKRDKEGHRALAELAGCLVQAGETKKAIEAFSEALKQFPSAAELHAGLGEALLASNAKGRAVVSFRKAAQLFAEQNDYSAAQALAEKVLAIDPLDVTTRAALVESLLSHEQTDPALAHARILAAQYAERNLLDLAEIEYRRIVSHDPGDLASWRNILEIVERTGKPTEHLSDSLLVAELLVQRGLLDDAVRLYQRAAQLDPNNIETRRALIETRLQMGNEHDLIEDYLELAELLSAHDQPDEAAEIYRRVLALEPNHPVAAYHLGRIESHVSQPPSGDAAPPTSSITSPAPGSESPLRAALDNYRHILTTNPDNPLIRARMAAVLFQLGEAEEALKEWDRASAELFQTGDFKSVISLCEKTLQIDPNRSHIQDRLAQAKLRKDSMAAVDSALDALEDRPPTS